jgi:large-conductance mechanosensitive channel
MSPSRDEAKQNLLNALRALVVTGNLHDWVSVMMLFAIPMSFGLALHQVLRSLIDGLITPILIVPVVAGIGIDIRSWIIPLSRTNAVPIGPLILDIITFGVMGLVLFGLTRLLRKWL